MTIERIRAAAAFAERVGLAAIRAGDWQRAELFARRARGLRAWARRKVTGRFFAELAYVASFDAFELRGDNDRSWPPLTAAIPLDVIEEADRLLRLGDVFAARAKALGFEGNPFMEYGQ